MATNHGQLINTLQALKLCEAHSPEQHFAQKLGELLDLPDAFVVADSLRGLTRMVFNNSYARCDGHAIEQQFAQHKQTVEQTLINKIQQHTRFDQQQAESYSRFYALCQSELEHSVLKIRNALLPSLQQHSDRMARLVFLDTLLHDKLGAQLRSFYQSLPKLVEKHFYALQQPEQQPDMIMLHQAHSHDWPIQLQHDMQCLLFAELSLRLQPLAGLIEAVNEETETFK